jgi:plasmid stabilization system protein ParE
VSHWIYPDSEAELEEAALYLAEHANPALAEALLLEYERVVALLIENQ